MNTAHLRAAIECGDEQALRLREALQQQRMQSGDSRATLDSTNLLLPPEQFEFAITTTQERCSRLRDAVTVIEAHFAQRLSEEEERRFAREMHQMASRPGDVVGRVDDSGGYAVALPWTEEEQAKQLAGVLENMAAYAAPDLACVVGHQTLRTAEPRPALVTVPRQPGSPSGARTASAVAAPTRRTRHR